MEGPTTQKGFSMKISGVIVFWSIAAQLLKAQTVIDAFKAENLEVSIADLEAHSAFLQIAKVMRKRQHSFASEDGSKKKIAMIEKDDTYSFHVANDDGKRRVNAPQIGALWFDGVLQWSFSDFARNENEADTDYIERYKAENRFTNSEVAAFVQTMTEAQAAFDRCNGYVSYDRLHLLIKNEFAKVAALQLRRTGAIYFVPNHEDKFDKVTKIKRAVSSFGAVQTITQYMEESKEALAHSAAEAFNDRAEQLYSKLREIGEAGKISRTKVKNSSEEIKALLQEAEIFENLLQIKLDDFRNQISTAQTFHDEISKDAVALKRGRKPGSAKAEPGTKPQKALNPVSVKRQIFEATYNAIKEKREAMLASGLLDLETLDRLMPLPIMEVEKEPVQTDIEDLSNGVQIGSDEGENEESDNEESEDEGGITRDEFKSIVTEAFKLAAKEGEAKYNDEDLSGFVKAKKKAGAKGFDFEWKLESFGVVSEGESSSAASAIGEVVNAIFPNN
jgi:hypothetical protein